MHAMGDDLKIMITDNADDDSIMGAIDEVSNEIGWIAREIVINKDKEWETFVAHTIKTQRLVTKKQHEIKLDLIYREGNRPMAKLLLSGDTRGNLNERGRTIMSSKSLSFILCYWTRIDILIISLVTMYKMSSDVKTEFIQTSWAARNVIKELNFYISMSKIMEIHTGIMIKIEKWLIDEADQEIYNRYTEQFHNEAEIDDNLFEIFKQCNKKKGEIMINKLIKKIIKSISIRYKKRIGKQELPK